MTPADPAQPLCFNAAFPPEEQYVETAGELAGRMAVSAGLAEDIAGALARQVEGAFSRAVAGGAPQIDLALSSGAETVTVTVSAAGSTLLTETRPRPQ